MATTRTRKTTKSAQTLDLETAELIKLRAENAELRKLLAEAEALAEQRLADSVRKEKILRVYQFKAKKAARPAAPAGAFTPRAMLEHAAAQHGIPMHKLSLRSGVVYHRGRAL